MLFYQGPLIPYFGYLLGKNLYYYSIFSFISCSKKYIINFFYKS